MAGRRAHERSASARSCARALAGVLGELRGTKLPGATPLRTTALRPHVERLEAIDARLLDGEPVAAAGMLAVSDLLTSPDSCLFAEVDSVESSLRRVLVKLTVLLMYDLAALAIAAACFAFIFVLRYVLEKI